MAYFNKPPKPTYRFGNVPEFIKKFYQPNRVTASTRYIIALVNWCEKEFADIYASLIATQNKKALALIKNNKIDCLYFLAQTKEFDQLVRDIDSEMWDQLPYQVQNTLIKTYSYYHQTA